MEEIRIEKSEKTDKNYSYEVIVKYYFRAIHSDSGSLVEEEIIVKQEVKSNSKEYLELKEFFGCEPTDEMIKDSISNDVEKKLKTIQSLTGKLFKKECEHRHITFNSDTEYLTINVEKFDCIKIAFDVEVSKTEY